MWQVLSVFIQEEKLLMAASDSTGASPWFSGMPLVAASDSTSASSCLCGMLVLPAVGVTGASNCLRATEAASDSIRELSSVVAALKTKRPSITKAKRSKI